MLLKAKFIKTRQKVFNKTVVKNLLGALGRLKQAYE